MPSSPLIASLVPATLRQAYRRGATAAEASASFGRHGAVVWCDVAKFSPLANRLVNLGATGVERLSTILNGHFEAVLGTALGRGGDALQFFGDGVLIAFFCEPGAEADAARRAAACAAAIVADCRPELEPGLQLSLHLHVTIGSLRMLDLGGVGGERLHVAVGDALAELGAISRDQSANTVILSPRIAALLGEAHQGERLLHGGCLMRGTPAPSPGPRPAGLDDESDEGDEALARFLPLPVRHGLELGALRWSAELRTITAVFLRLPALDHASADFEQRLHEMSRLVQAACRRYEGLVRCIAFDEKGAGFQLVFGVPPLAHPDDPLRALRCTVELIAELRNLGLTCSAGITAGTAFVGIIGHPARRHYAVIGDAINMASRLSHASESTILCDEATMRACEGRMSFRELAPILVKGRVEAMPIWSPEAPTEAAALGIVIGRDREYARLLMLLDAAAAGRTGAALLVGEPGMGKSLLMATTARTARVRGCRVLIAESSRIEQGTPFQALREAFLQLFGIQAGDAPAARRQRVETRYAAHAERLGLINAVVPLGLPDGPWLESLQPGERGPETRRLLIDLLTHDTATAPLLLIIEDAHWIDEESLRTLVELLGSGGRVALLVGSRPPGTALARLVEAGAERLALDALDRAGCAEIIAAELGATEVATDIVDLVFRRARGNPFFTAELSRYLAGSGSLRVGADGRATVAGADLSLAELPISVRATITNRVDAMASAPQLTLKVESVAGARAPLAMVSDVHPLHAPLAQVAEHLLVQARLGLVDRALVDAVEGYEFRHDITREVVYDLVLPEPRRDLHGEIARWYERTHAEDLPAYFGRIAAHYSAAGAKEQATVYLEREALRVFGNGYPAEAIEITTGALRELGHELPTESGAIAAAIGGNYAEITARTAAGAAAVVQSLAPLQDRRVQRQIALLLRLVPFAFQTERNDLYALAATGALRLTLEHGTCHDAAPACSMYSIVHGAMTGDRVVAWQWSELGLQLLGGRRDGAFSEVAFVHTWFHAHWQRPLRDSLALSHEATEAGFASGALMYACFNMSGYVIYQQACGERLDAVIASARPRIQRNAQRVRNSAWHLVHELQQAKAYAGLTRDPRSMSDDEFDEDRDLASILQTRWSNQIGYYLVSKVRLYAHYGDWAVALDWATRARAVQSAYQGQTAEFELSQFEGLAASGLALERGEALDERGVTCLRHLRHWATLCPDNFAHKALLLEGAALATEGRDAEGVAVLLRSAALAAQQGYRQDRALALEWATRLTRRSGDDPSSLLEQAVEACEDWGARAKADWLRASLDEAAAAG